MREAWTDERLDDLNARVDSGFDRVDARFEQIDRRFEHVDEEFKAVRSEMKEGFDAVNGRIDSLQRTMVQAIIAQTAGMLAGFGGLAALIATQL